MNTTTLNELLGGPEVVARVGWTLVHSLWQIACVAVMLLVTLFALRRRSASDRYLAACAAMIACVMLPVITLLSLSVPDMLSESITVEPPATPVETATIVLSSSAVTPAPTPQSEPTHQPSSWVDRFVESILQWIHWIVVGWMTGVCALSLWNIGGWLAVQRVRRVGTSPVTRAVRTRVDQLAQRMGIRAAVGVLESSLTGVPLVVGWVRPLILAPAAVLNGLSAGELDAILAHELAHVRRRDYLVNLAQTIVETLLFYHPAVWWISAKLRQERENCCDDIAAETCGSRIVYAEALAALAAMRCEASPLPAVAVTGARNSLIHRIRRIVTGQENPAARSRSLGAAATVGLLVALMMTLMMTDATAEAPDAASPSAGDILADVNPPTSTSESATIGKEPIEARVAVNDALISAKQHEIRQLSKEYQTDDLKPWYEAQLAEMMKVQSLWTQAALERQMAELTLANQPNVNGAQHLTDEQIAAMDPTMRKLLRVSNEAAEEVTRLRSSGLMENHRTMIHARVEVDLAKKASEEYAAKFREQFGVMRDGKAPQVIEDLKAREVKLQQLAEAEKKKTMAIGEKYLHIKDLKDDIEKLKEENREFAERIEQSKVGARTETHESTSDRAVRLVIHKENMTFQGQPVTWDTLPAAMLEVSDRRATAVELAWASDDIPISRFADAKARAIKLANELGFKHLSDVGQHVRASARPTTRPTRQP